MAEYLHDSVDRCRSAAVGQTAELMLAQRLQAPHPRRRRRQEHREPGRVIRYLREHEITLTWNPAAAALQARATQTAKTVTVTAR